MENLLHLRAKGVTPRDGTLLVTMLIAIIGDRDYKLGGNTENDV